MKSLRLSLSLLIVLGILTGCEGSYRTQVTVGKLSLPAGGTGVVRISILNPPDAQMIQVGPTGLLTFNPSVIQVISLTGVNGFTIFGSTINNTMGWVQFVASFPGGASGPSRRWTLGCLKSPSSRWLCRLSAWWELRQL
jgi:hypothetical protein